MPTFRVDKKADNMRKIFFLKKVFFKTIFFFEDKGQFASQGWNFLCQGYVCHCRGLNASKSHSLTPTHCRRAKEIRLVQHFILLFMYNGKIYGYRSVSHIHTCDKKQCRRQQDFRNRGILMSIR